MTPFVPPYIVCAVRRTLALFSTRYPDADLNVEIQAHLDLLVDEHVRGGMPPVEARAAARRTFGGVEQMKETYRDQRGLPFVDALGQDLKYAIRTVRKNRGFTVVAVLTLALGIGANTAIFTLIDALMLRALPVAHPEELVSLTTFSARDTDDQFSYAAYQRFRDGASHVAEVIAASTPGRVNIVLNGESDVVERQSVSGNYFAMLGIPALHGRLFLDEDDRLPGGQPVAILSHRYWTRRLGRDPAIVGRTFTIRDTAFTIVGVMPPGFFGDTVGEATDIWTPLAVQPGAPPWLWQGHSVTWLRLLARRAPGMTIEQTRAVFEPVFTSIRDEIAGAERDERFRRQALENRLGVLDGSRGVSRVRNIFSLPLSVLMALVGLVLVIACANVANLLLARAASRQREVAMRLAIGAGRWRLIRQILTEAVLLAALGGALGLLLAIWGTRILVVLASRASTPISLELGPDARVLAFAAVVSFVTALAFGLAPALRAAQLDLLPALREAAGSARSGARFRSGRALVVGEIALSLVLLVGASLFVRSLMNLRRIDLGFNPDRVLVFKIDGPSGGNALHEEEARQLHQRMLERVERIPGVQAVSLSAVGLFTNSTWGNSLTVEGDSSPPGNPVRALANAVSARYFQVMAIPVLQGRSFSDADHERAPKVALVNETFARRFFSGADPVGKRVGLGAPARSMMEIVGVVKDAKYVNLREANRSMVYVPFTQHPSQITEVEVRTAGDAAAAVANLRRELAAVDRRLPVLQVAEMRDQVDASIAAERLIANLSSAFGLLALILAAVGLYGVIAYVSARRTAEIGIRMALGAQRTQVLWLVMKDALLMLAGGAALGLPAAWAASRLVSSLLFGLRPEDPSTILVATAVLMGVGALAGFLPARRAARVDPMVALRHE